MRVGMISDIHDHLASLDAALDLVADCDVLVCLGDLCSPFTMAAIGKGFHGPIHLVWGNNDGDRASILRVSEGFPNITIHGEFAELELDGACFALTHWPEIGAALARGGQHDWVCHGHNHRRRAELVGRTWLVNPGEVMGRLGVRSVAVADTATRQTELLEF